MGIKDQMDSTFEVDPEKIDNMAKNDIASGGQLPLPGIGEHVNIKYIGSPRLVENEKMAGGKAFVARCVIFGEDDGLQFDVFLPSTIYKGMLAELKKFNVEVDDDMKCIVHRVFTVSGKQWDTAPKEMWRDDPLSGRPVPPKTYNTALRPDLEAREGMVQASVEGNPGGSSPDLFSF